MTEPSRHQDDPQLIELTLAGQTSAFGVLIGRYQDRLFNSMQHILRSESDAEDVVQDAFVLAFTKLDSFRGNSQFFTWLYRIAYNVAITRLRRNRPMVSIEGKADSKRLDFADAGLGPDDQLDRTEQIEQLYQALERLSVEHRSILILRELEELDYDAISEILDLPIGTVRSRLHRARNHLREHLEAMINRP